MKCKFNMRRIKSSTFVRAPAGDKRTLQHSATDSLSRCISPRISTRLILSLFYSISTSMLYAQQERKYVHMYSNIKNALTGASLPHIGSSDYLTIPSAYRVREEPLVEKDTVCGGFSTFTGQL